MTDPTRTKILREEFASLLKKLPEKAKKRVKEIIETAYKIDEDLIEEIKKVIEEEMGPEAAEKIINKYTDIFWQRGASFASRQLKKFGIEIIIPTHLTILDEETINQLKNLQLELVRGLSEETKKKVAFHIRDGLLRGESIQQITKRITEVLGDDAKKRAEKIARTEATRVFNKAAESRYSKAGIKYWRWLAAKDERSCSICGSRHGKIFKIGDPTPPAHPNCRCTMVPILSLKSKEARISIKRESKEIALQHYARVVSKIPTGKFVPDEENIRKVAQALRRDERFKQLAEMLEIDAKEFAERYAQEALQILRENFTKHGIDRAVELEKHGIAVVNILRLKKRGKRYISKRGQVNVLAKIGGKHDPKYIRIVLDENDKIITVHRISKRKYEKYKERWKEVETKSSKKRVQKSWIKRRLIFY